MSFQMVLFGRTLSHAQRRQLLKAREDVVGIDAVAVRRNIDQDGQSAGEQHALFIMRPRLQRWSDKLW